MEGLVGNIDNIQGSSNKVLKAYITEYLYRSRIAISRENADLFIKLIESKTFNFTAPENEFKDIDEPMERFINYLIITLLKIIVDNDNAWAETILNHLLCLIKKYETNERLLFGI